MFKYLWLLGWLTLQPDPTLQQTVRDYWAALQARDKVRAMHFVHPDDLNKFLNRNEPRFNKWRLEEIEPATELEATVSVNISRLFPGGSVQPVRTREVWQRLESGWKVRIQSLVDHQSQLRQRLVPPAELPASLDVFPTTIKFYPDSDQPGVIVIRNGLKSPVRIAELTFDEQMFQVSQQPVEIAARSVGRIALHYVGSDQAPNLKSHLQLVLKVGGDVREFPIPVLCNYSDPTLEWLKRQKPPQASRPPQRQLLQSKP